MYMSVCVCVCVCVFLNAGPPGTPMAGRATMKWHVTEGGIKELVGRYQFLALGPSTTKVQLQSLGFRVYSFVSALDNMSARQSWAPSLGHDFCKRIVCIHALCDAALLYHFCDMGMLGCAISVGSVGGVQLVCGAGFPPAGNDKAGHESRRCQGKGVQMFRGWSVQWESGLQVFEYSELCRRGFAREGVIARLKVLSGRMCCRTPKSLGLGCHRGVAGNRRLGLEGQTVGSRVRD
jgi:hypothetical protein